MILLFCSTLYAQNFALQVTPTQATCASGGSLTFSVEHETPGAPVTYTVYLLPDIANPVTQTVGSTVSNLDAGNYYVSATQSTEGGDLTTTAQATIADNSQLAITIINTTPLCGNENNGSFTVNVTSGIAATYQLTDYPGLPPAQTSPNFSGLIPGYYEITVTDICGNQVIEYKLIASDMRFGVDSLRFTNIYPDCNELSTALWISSNAEGGGAPIAYPLTVVYTIHPDGGGADIVIEQEIESGDPWFIAVDQTLPNAIPGEILDVDVLVVYPCGTAEHVEWGSPPGQQPINIPELEVIGDYVPAICSQKYLTVGVNNLMLPYTLEFTEYPEGFDPATFSTTYPGPYNNIGPVAFGNYNMPVPVGFYRVIATDACGNSKAILFTITPTAQVIYSQYNYDCVNNLGGLYAHLEGFESEVNLANATLIDAPAEYDVALPLDVTPFISSEHELWLSGLPPGTYTVIFADACGNSFSKAIKVNSFVPSAMVGDTRPDCEAGLGTVKISTYNLPLTGMSILNAPDGFPYPLPYDVSFNINADGNFYMDGLPAGFYRFLGVDGCYDPNKPRYYSPTVLGYEATTNDLQIIPGCSAYDITLNYISNATDENFWLQKQLPDGSWAHPVSGQVYIDGATPTADTAMPIVNTQTLTVNGWEGTYRILRHHETYTPVTGLKNCAEEIHRFDLHQNLELLETNILSCPGDPITIELITNGAAPVTYTIKRKNNIPYLIQNGEDNIFTGLEPATYTVEITDSCSRTLTVDIVTQDATPLIVVHDPGTLYTCDVKNDGIDVFTLSLQNAGILGSQDADEYTVTYHTLQANADIGIEALPDEYTSEPKTIYARVIKNDTPGCYETIAFSLQLYEVPELNINSPVAFCAGQTVTVAAPAGFVSYLWSNGVTTRENEVSTEGLYTVTVTNANGCQTAQTVTVLTSPVPEILNIETTDFTDSQNSITISIRPTALPTYPEYSLDGVTFQESNVFEHLEAGRYTVFVRDQFGCGIDSKTVYLLNYPKYFTPNGDSYNDKWRIEYATVAAREMIVYIYDRFGRLITSFDTRSTGWDGTLDGSPVPADDYWFVVQRENNAEFRGHFALIR
jgi:gliding motility-associated-like protein